MKIVVLCGGVGGSKLVLGLHHEFPDDEFTIVVNTADDLEFLGLHVSPDLDTVTYTLAGLVNPETGWGLDEDTFSMLGMLERYGYDGWFRVGDRDVATHITRTEILATGGTLTEAIRTISTRLGVRETILPMTDDRVRTRVRLESGWVPFQEYFVQRRYRDQPLEVEHAGAPDARMTEAVQAAIREADVIVATPSNPVVSLRPILSIPGMVEAVVAAQAPTIAVSPFVRDRSVTGPADALMGAIGLQPTSTGLARFYSPWLNFLVVHETDREMAPEIEEAGVKPVVTDTMMPDLDAKRRLARQVIEAVT